MKKLITILLILISLQLVSAEDYSLAKQLELNLNLSSTITLTPTKSSYSIDKVISDLYFFPQDTDKQEVILLETFPEATEQDNILRFEWQSPEEKELQMYLTARIRTENKIKKIRTKIPFPLQDIPEEYVQYTKPSALIDSDNAYQVVFKLFDFVKSNVDYDLSCAERIEKASGVLENKKGTCDEFTNLFVALVRALGIPAQYISGISYSNLPQLKGFNWHAWARVYFPDYGWIDVDPTYGEFNSIDASHVLLNYGLSGNESSTRYEWTGRNINLVASSLEMKADVTEQIGNVKPLLDLNLEMIEDSVGFGSFNLVKATITNPNNYYIATTLTLAAPSQISVLNKEKRILLPPKSKKQVYWIINLTKNLQKNYIYTFPLQLFSERNATAKTEFKSSAKDDVFSFEEINKLFKQLQEEEKKVYSKEIYLNCSSDKKRQYLYEKPVLNCEIKNKGNIYLENISVCLEKDCKIFNLGIAQEKTFSFNITEQLKRVRIIAINKEISKTIFPDLEILDIPKINITDLNFPLNVSFNQKYTISFTLEKESKSIPKNITINLGNKKLNLAELNKTQNIIFNLKANDLKPGKNIFNLTIRYLDENNKEYSVSKSFELSLVNVNIFQKIYLFFRRLLEL